MAFSASFFPKQEQHCSASARLQRLSFDKHASFEGQDDDSSFILDHVNLLISK